MPEPPGQPVPAVLIMAVPVLMAVPVPVRVPVLMAMPMPMGVTGAMPVSVLICVFTGVTGAGRTGRRITHDAQDARKTRLQHINKNQPAAIAKHPQIRPRPSVAAPCDTRKPEGASSSFMIMRLLLVGHGVPNPKPSRPPQPVRSQPEPVISRVRVGQTGQTGRRGDRKS